MANQVLTPEEIEAHILFVTAELGTLAAGEQDLSGCVEIEKRFRTLRDQYRREPDSLAEHVERLSALRRRFDTLLAERLTLVVDRFYEVNEEIRRCQQEKALWRDLLIHNATRTEQEHLNGTTAMVRVRTIRCRTLPAAGGSERSRLEDLIRESGRWEQVSQLSRPKLERALAGNLFTGPQANAIEQLCPATVMHQVSSQVSDG